MLGFRMEHREGPADLALRCDISARTLSRILARAGVPRLWKLDLVTGARIRASRAPTAAMNATFPGT